ncbi:bifunctional 2-polyprenyl-6-hydroxyphenol methylase/3-demethylubiquinol 3-O-methyltransferase UbiG [Haematospirillum jordaniae]|uniref:Ubiquinone biosynthesis O-methyltransferase n=1 Tax=Haematospirillum jordaniae TaxID=1549855 RepID=A0A143DFU7_9PROT|nr:bifunctional 2-polyprenyl-6-hydroxyphenol methylase/3-demethylubiquinol 3-O-methyltransferase UbiG [Haematospirillum jordaniae]AMW35605.1 bifunctional 3-demethylubiquinol 3-O-methyltransferase/2-polyprenyl-6-hydroxyphenol methylase [Haematospirillum jordaniae]NKD45745.1 bifunctional 2-polyprenyl-6-hydroxyphenol methylase/3-demethylubiquinol 3-O-methyltransferase UbiG [Haematospirillum jordaniae]NKD56719.1 bifunctional 2-polyprenyl-6-hydroxyphenol methylase/3-demethylubiquinol 3-O-methyltransf
MNKAQTTASPEELAKFEAMADSWWDPEGKFKPLHRFNPQRLSFIRDAACAHFRRNPADATPFQGLSLVDIGCGGGLLSEPMARLGFAVTGIDGVEKNIGTARTHAARSGLDIDYRATLAENLVEEKAQFDVVLSMEVVEHVADPDFFLKTCASLVKPGGMLVGATINRTIRSMLLAKIGAEYILRWLPKGTHDWDKFVKPSEFAAGLRRGGMEVTDLRGMSYNPLSGDWSITDDLSVNYLLIAKHPA